MPEGGDCRGPSWRLATPARFEGKPQIQPTGFLLRNRPCLGARDTTARGKARDTARDLAEVIIVGKLGAKQLEYECHLREVVGVRVGM